jgi:hypothetical protein
MTSRIPPTAWARLEMFCALVDDYDELAQEFPVGTDFAFDRAQRPPSDKWNRIVRAMTLRKFVLAKTDQVYVSKVLSAVNECSSHEQTPEIVSAFAHSLNLIGERGRFVDRPGHPGFGASQLVEDLIYGGLLHGDYEKWNAVHRRGDLMTEGPLFQFVSDAEHLVRRLRSAIRAGIEEGVIAPESSDLHLNP